MFSASRSTGPRQPSSAAAHAGCSEGWVRARDPGRLWEPSSPSERGLETLTRSHGCSLLPHWAPDGSLPGHTTMPELTTVMLVGDERRRRPPLPPPPATGARSPPPATGCHTYLPEGGLWPQLSLASVAPHSLKDKGALLSL